METYSGFGVRSDDSRDGPHAVGLGDEAQAGDDGVFGERRHLSRSQLLHLALGEVSPKRQHRCVSLCVTVAEEMRVRT